MVRIKFAALLTVAAEEVELRFCSLKINFKIVRNALISIHIQRARCKISYNNDFSGLQYKIIKMIRKMLTQYQSL